ncbi:MAG: histidine phosphatase family protein [Bacteroidetes bacterium]|nr:MAG: histidine phosphatase family protein [Bacteroidota bacterium]TAG89652.1 MAG: histidine phosphatase family protein [Bacteroidota bacterium]
MKKIYLIRHGETDFNRLGMVQGSGIDTDLNELGRKQANAFFEAFKHIPFDKIYTSALKRTHQSVQRFTTELQIPHHILTGLNEISWGLKEGRKPSAEEDIAFENILQRWSSGDLEVAFEGGETPLQVLARQKEALKIILSQEEEKNIIICMHGRAMRILLCELLNYSLSEMDFFLHGNLCLYQLTYTGNMFRVDKANYKKHLANIV